MNVQIKNVIQENRIPMIANACCDDLEIELTIDGSGNESSDIIMNPIFFN